MIAKIMENIETGQKISKKKEKYQKNKGKHIINDIRQKKTTTASYTLCAACGCLFYQDDIRRIIK